ncbi:MAG TPA: hypothetical protein VGM82_20560 [Gemmatimonadaceae bacterium]|jgi:hypothetical protein
MVARALIVASLAVAAASRLDAQSVSGAYRARLLGVFDAQSGAPIEGVEVGDMLSKAASTTTATGTVALSFLPEGESLVRVRKLGYVPMTIPVAISPDDTVPLTVLLKPSAQVLPTVVTNDSAPRHLSPGLQAFDERRRTNVGGYFVAEDVLRKNETKRMTSIIRTLPGVAIDCAHYGIRAGQCWPVTTRMGRISGGCAMQIYTDGIAVVDDDLEKMRVDQFAGVEYYPGGASVPPQYNKTGSSCGTLLLWTRER